jgi:hypothetical protein
MDPYGSPPAPAIPEQIIMAIIIIMIVGIATIIPAFSLKEKGAIKYILQRNVNQT